MSKPLIGPEGVPEYLKFREDGSPVVRPDKYGALQLILAASGGEVEKGGDAIEKVLRERPAVPLISGLIFFNLAFARALYGDRRTELLNHLALDYSMEESGE